MRTFAPERMAVATLAIAAWVTPCSAHAHGPAPVVLEVVAVARSTDGAIVADVLRTNVGVALANPDGSFAYLCPSRFEGTERALVAALPDRAGIAFVETGRATISDDTCSFHEAPATDRIAFRAVTGTQDLPGERGALLFLGRLRDGAALEDPVLGDRVLGDSVLVDAAGRVHHRFPAGVHPDDLRVVDDVLLVAGADGLWVADVPDAQDASIRLTEVPGLDHADADDVVRRSIRGVSHDMLWLVATTGEGRVLERVTGTTQSGSFAARLMAGVVVDRDAPRENIHGPVRLGDTWLALIDGVRMTRPVADPAGMAFTPHEPSRWTCLQAIAGEVFACSLDALLHLTGDGSEPTSTPHFRFRQLGAPSPACTAATGDCCDHAAQACMLDWAHFGGEAGWLETAPATAPNGTRVPLDAGAAAPSPRGGGCDCSVRPAVGALPEGTPLAVGGFAWLERRRSRRHGQRRRQPKERRAT